MDDKENIYQNKSKDIRKNIICAIIGICMAGLLMGTGYLQRKNEVNAHTAMVQKELAKEVFRFHVLANSDSESDQQVKLKVRDAVLSYMKDELGESASEEETKEWAKAHLPEIENVSEKILREEGYSYNAKAEVATCYFPEKRYGDMTFPAGDYEALRIKLGKANGQNWWCVLYPSLCFMDTTCAVVSEEGKDELKHVLDEEEYEMITASTKFKIRWFFFGNDKEEK